RGKAGVDTHYAFLGSSMSTRAPRQLILKYLSIPVRTRIDITACKSLALQVRIQDSSPRHEPTNLFVTVLIHPVGHPVRLCPRPRPCPGTPSARR
ncbi:hypothetical protein J6590_023078, partial [Homalodisca vitripennis]